MWEPFSPHPANMDTLNPFNTCQAEKQYLPVQFAISWSLVRLNILYFFYELPVCLAIFFVCYLYFSYWFIEVFEFLGILKFSLNICYKYFPQFNIYLLTLRYVLQKIIFILLNL